MGKQVEKTLSHEYICQPPLGFNFPTFLNGQRIATTQGNPDSLC